jgi:hypothetical protein
MTDETKADAADAAKLAVNACITYQSRQIALDNLIQAAEQRGREAERKRWIDDSDYSNDFNSESDAWDRVAQAYKKYFDPARIEGKGGWQHTGAIDAYEAREAYTRFIKSVARKEYRDLANAMRGECAVLWTALSETLADCDWRGEGGCGGQKARAALDATREGADAESVIATGEGADES